ncbi:oligosaccharide flippase family protein [Paenibacillus sp. TAF43_2]|uniref:oligosaccharide flippase family protein n=1 Tax=Paenibacillus sp. TAF43_2 TaxID=3233069 RepID=UPI003F9DD85B
MNRKPGENGQSAEMLGQAGKRKTSVGVVEARQAELTESQERPCAGEQSLAKAAEPAVEGRVQLERSSKQHLMNGVALMAGAALLSKLIGVFQKIPLQNLAGDRVFGIYNAVYPFYQLAAVLATAGLPTAVSLLIAERLRKGDDAEGVRRTLYAALLLLGVTGIISFGLMWGGANQVAGWIGDAQTAGAVRSVSFALLLAPFVAALRGYVQGIGQMGLSAASQVVEQMIRVGVMLLVLALSWSAGWADASVASGVMSGSAFGACASLLLLAIYLWRRRSGERLNRMAGAIRAEMRKLAVIALPVALGAVVVPVLGVVDAFMVPRLLQEGGASEAAAMTLFGVYSRAQPLVQLVVMVAGAAAAALVPSIALARMRGAYGQLRVQLSLAERAAWAIGAAAAIGLALLAEPLNMMLYSDTQGTFAFALVGCTALAGSVNAVTAPVLQGLGAVRIPAILLLVAALLKGVINAVLVPTYGIEGAAIAGVAALSVAALLGIIAVRYAASGSGAALAGGRAGVDGRVKPGERVVGEKVVRERVLGEEQGRGQGQERMLKEEQGRVREMGQGLVQGREWWREQEQEQGQERMLKEEQIRVREMGQGRVQEQEQELERMQGREDGRQPSHGRAAAGTVFALAVMAAALVIAERALSAALGGLPPRAAAAALALTCVAVGACAFGAAALRGGAISARELRALPGGAVLAARLQRWRLIPPAKDER